MMGKQCNVFLSSSNMTICCVACARERERGEQREKRRESHTCALVKHSNKYKSQPLINHSEWNRL